MSLSSKKAPAFLILFSLLFTGLIASLLVSGSLSSPNRGTGASLAVQFIHGRVCRPLNLGERFLRREPQALSSAGANPARLPEGCRAADPLVAYYFLCDAPNTGLSPLRIAEFYHLGDGMK